MTEKFGRYAQRQKRFWNVPDVETAKFDRIHIESGRTEEEWSGLAKADVEFLLNGVAIRPGDAILRHGSSFRSATLVGIWRAGRVQRKPVHDKGTEARIEGAGFHVSAVARGPEGRHLWATAHR
jgi:hypothetical protein